MRVYSDFKDYYDVAQSFGQDNDLVYIRKEKEEKIKYPFPVLNDTFQISVYQYGVGFCGKVYPVCNVSISQAKYVNYYWESRSKYCFDAESIHDFIKENASEDQKKNYFSKKRYSFSWGNNFSFNETGVNSYFKKMEDEKDKHKELFKDSPIFRVYMNRDGSFITYNSKLKDIEFYRLFDPFTAYQELSMYLANQAVPMKEIPEMSDDVKIALKGFDKFSFRKDKQK